MRPFKCLYYIILLVCLSLVSHHGTGQTHKVDSLLSLLDEADTDTARVRVYNELVYSLFRSSLDSAALYADKAMALARASGDLKSIAYSHNSNGIIAHSQSDYKTAMAHYNSFYRIADSIGDNAGKHRALNNLGIVSSRMAQYEEALQYLNESLLIQRQLGETAQMGLTYHNIGLNYEFLGDHREALANYLQSVKIKKDNKQEDRLSTSYRNIGLIKSRLELYDEARQYYDLSLRYDLQYKDKRGLAYDYQVIGQLLLKSQPDSLNIALDYISKALKISKQLNNRVSVGGLLNMTGEIYYKKDDYDSALYYYEEAEQVLSEVEYYYTLCDVWLNKAQLKLTLGEDRAALKYAQKSWDKAKELRMKQEMMQASGLLYQLYARANNLKDAYEYLLQHKLYTDSILTEAKLDELHNLEARHTLEQMAKENELLQKENELRRSELKISETRIKNQKITLFVALFAMIALVLLAFNLFKSYRAKRHANILLEGFNKEITRQKDQISFQANALTAANEEIKQINSSLEKTVKDRTHKIREQNKKLRAYAFTNSHKLRAPVARLLGLCNLFSNPEVTEQDKIYILKMLVEASEDLDDIIRDITKTLHHEDFDDI